jgi:hypothetical protein
VNIVNCSFSSKEPPPNTESAPAFKTISLLGIVYKGNVDSRGRPSGAGSLLFSQGDRYDGEFVEGRRCGRGTYTFVCGDVYDGLWKDDMRNGCGTLRYSNGDVYDGEWRNDARSGAGSLVFSDGSSFVGEWIDDSYGPGTFSEKQDAA